MEQSSTAGRVVVVTGGAKGIGRAYSVALADAGYRVAIADIAGAEEGAAELRAAGAEAIGIQVDISSETDTQRMADVVEGEWGHIDGLINNAAFFSGIHKARFDELTVADWEHILRINVIGTWLCCRAVFPGMVARGSGKIINTASMVVPTATPHFLHYVASKSAIVGMTRSLAHEVGEFGITVNTISPCYIPHDDDYAGRQDPAMGLGIISQRAIKREMVPEDLVGTALYLMSPGSDFVTGQNLYVNGGRAFT